MYECNAFLVAYFGGGAPYCKAPPFPSSLRIEEIHWDITRYRFLPGSPENVFRIVSIGPTCWVRLEVGRLLINPHVLLFIIYCTEEMFVIYCTEEMFIIFRCFVVCFNPLKPKLNPICYLLALLGAHHFLHVIRIRVKLLTFRLLMSYIYIYGAPILDVSRSHTTTQHSR